MQFMELSKVDLAKRGRGDGFSDSEHPDIDQRKLYLAKVNGSYFIGKFHRVWFGWTFTGWHNCLQLSSISEGLWEILSLPDDMEK